MPGLTKTTQLLQRVLLRLRVAAFARRWYWFFLGTATIFAVCVLASRLLGVLPHWISWNALWVLAIVPLIAAWFFRARPTLVEAARAVDGHLKSKDLFLTAASLDHAAGEFQPLVVERVEQTASKVQPTKVVPFAWTDRMLPATVAVAVLIAGMLWLPQLDPFGQVAKANEKQTLRNTLAESEKAAKLRIETLRENEPSEETSKKVDRELEKLSKSFKKMKAGKREPNRQKLADRQKELGKKWREASGKALKERLASRGRSDQSFGKEQKESLRKWKRELDQGGTNAVSKHLEDTRDKLRRLQKEKDPVEREKLAKDLKQQLKDLEDFAKDQAASKSLSAAVERALDQFDASSVEGLSAEALEGLAQSLDLTELELEQLAQSARDLKKLEKALKLVQQAKKLNEKDLLDGEACAACESLEDYEKMFADMIAKAGGQGGLAGTGNGGQGDGAGLGGKGTGRGGKAPEDDTVDSKFKTEQSTSAITAGKILLSLKSKGLGESGTAKKEHRELVKNLKQAVSDAILQEQIPSGYHDDIKKYFDTIEQDSSEANDGQE